MFKYQFEAPYKYKQSFINLFTGGGTSSVWRPNAQSDRDKDSEADVSQPTESINSSIASENRLSLNLSGPGELLPRIAEEKDSPTNSQETKQLEKDKPDKITDAKSKIVPVVDIQKSKKCDRGSGDEPSPAKNIDKIKDNKDCDKSCELDIIKDKDKDKDSKVQLKEKAHASSDSKSKEDVKSLNNSKAGNLKAEQKLLAKPPAK